MVAPQCGKQVGTARVKATPGVTLLDVLHSLHTASVLLRLRLLEPSFVQMKARSKPGLVE